MDFDLLTMLEGMAQSGTAPPQGCSLFGVGFADVYTRLQKTFLDGRLARGGSAQKYVIGPFGSGKTHFLRHLSELSRGKDFVTVEISLDKNMDYTNRLLMYRELAGNLVTPGQKVHGMLGLLRAVVARIENKTDQPEQRARLLAAWAGALGEANFAWDTFARILKRAILAMHDGENTIFDAACRWLNGEMNNKEICRILSEEALSGPDLNIYAQRAMFSLFQFIRHAGFKGTVVAYDEADIGFAVDKRKLESILAYFRASIDDINDLQKGSVLIVYGITPDVYENMKIYEALRQRLADPGPQSGFFDGNTLAPTIDLTRRPDPLKELQEIGYSLVDLFYKEFKGEINIPKSETTGLVTLIATEVNNEESSASSRREMVKRTCMSLMRIYDSGLDITPACEIEFEDEV